MILFYGKRTPRFPVQFFSLEGVHSLGWEDGDDAAYHASQLEEGRGDGAHILYDVDMATDEGHVCRQLIQKKASQNICGEREK